MGFLPNYDGPGPERDLPRKTGIFRLWETLSRDFWDLFRAGFLALVGCVPFLLGAMYSISSHVLVYAPITGLLGGAIAGPGLCGLADTVLRGLRDEPGFWWPIYRRAWEGGELTIGFFGGSITQDCAATVHENCYACRVFRWWEQTFPAAKFHYVNGGIGGTSSHFGAARAVSDLLMYQPDFVVVDFSVNDVENGLRTETYEGVLRQLLSWTSAPAVVLLNNIYYDTGYTDQDCHNALGDSIRFTVDCACIAVQYRKTVRRPALSAQLVLDGDTGHPVFLDGNFGEDWGDCLWLEPVLHGGERRQHTVELTIDAAQGEGLTPFYLLSLIIA